MIGPAIEHYLLGLGVLLTVAIVTSRLSQLARIPDVVGLLLAGMVIGRAGLGIVDFGASDGGRLLLVIGAAYILFRGGMAVSWSTIRPVAITVILLATIGVLVTAAVTAVSVHIFFGLVPAAALLLAAVVAATDPATVIPVLQNARVIPRLSQALIAEAALNDATGAILTFTVLPFALGTSVASGPLHAFAWSAGIGILIGAVGGLLASWLIRERGWLAAYASLLLLGLVISTYAAAEAVHASGFMAVFLAGAVVGNLEYSRFAPHPALHFHTKHFLDTNAGLFRMLVFVLLGADIVPGALGDFFLPAVLTTAVLVFVARPLAVLACAAPDRLARWRLTELMFLGWSRETGVVPAALAGIVAAADPKVAAPLISVVTVAVITTVVLQGSTAGLVGAALGLREKEQSRPAPEAPGTS
ncbi:MAG: cation:proton antiporter [Candidatus Dormibacteraceae bacterium]